jgi:DNA-binding transcriptional LysR family regulator
VIKRIKNSKSPLVIPEDINWEYLKRFMICVECKNYKEACQKIGTSLSALSKQLDALEDELKITLFQRVNYNRTTNLTTEGKIIYVLTKDIDVHLKGFLKLKRANKDVDPRELKITTTQGIANTILAAPLNRFSEKHPNIKIDIKTEFTPRLINSDEIMIRADFSPQAEISKYLILTYEMNLYASKEYIQEFGAPDSFKDLMHHKNLIVSMSNMNASTTNWATLESGNLSMAYYVISDSIQLLFDMCQKGKGILELPSIYPGVNNLVRVLKNERTPVVEIYACGHKDLFYKEYISEFVDILKYEWRRISVD